MNELQITLICILIILGLAFFIVIFARFNENGKFHFAPSQKKIQSLVGVLQKKETTDEHWNEIWPLYYKNGRVNYTKVEIGLSYIINNSKYVDIHEQAMCLLRERVSISVFGDDEITEALEAFKKEVNLCGNQSIKEAGNILIKKFQRFCRRNANNKKYDLIIQWIFNAIEIVGFILAIITL